MTAGARSQAAIPPLAVVPVGLLALGPLVLFLLVSGRYGYFRDELYYIACSDRLAWGYVDQPPLSIALLALNRVMFGDSLLALRWIPALAGAAVAVLTGAIARKLGAGRFGQILAALATAVSPMLLSTGRYYSMNSLDLLLWTIAVLLLVVILREDRPGLWPLFGLVAGLGLLNKYSMGFLIAGIAAGLLLTRHRRVFREPRFWAAGAVAGVLFLPHVLWQVSHGWPSLEFMRNAALHKNVGLGPLEFLLAQVMEIGVVHVLVWGAGLAWFLVHRDGRGLRPFGWMYIALFGLMIATRAKAYYLAPAYPVLLAGGAVLIERLGRRAAGRRLGYALAGALVLSGAAAAPVVMPLLDLDGFLAYQKLIGFAPAPEERHEMGVLPQHYADQFGWPEMAATVAEIHRTLPAEERAGCLIYARNYGEAGAIDFFGPALGLPPATCPHNNYWLWGPPEWDGRTAIVFGPSRDMDECLRDLGPVFEEVVHAATLASPYAMPYENRPIFVCRRARFALRDIWRREKDFG